MLFHQRSSQMNQRFYDDDDQPSNVEETTLLLPISLFYVVQNDK